MQQKKYNKKKREEKKKEEKKNPAIYVYQLEAKTARQHISKTVIPAIRNCEHTLPAVPLVSLGRCVALPRPNL